MSESAHRMIEILRILNESDNPTGSKLIADELKKKGFNLGERAVRYHMQLLDEKGYTEKMGYSGRKITELGKETLEKGLIYKQVDFIYSKYEEMIYLCDFDYVNKKGNVVVNVSHIYEKNAYDIIKKVFDSGLCISPYTKIKKIKNGYELKTICGTTIDGILLNNQIPSLLQYGGLLEIEDNIPTRFKDLISYKKTSISPLDAFIAKDMTSILKVIEEGSGVIPANFRMIPATSQKKAIDIFKKLESIGINGIIEVGKPGENVLGIPVSEDMVGIAIVGGITPLCAAQESKYDINMKAGEDFTNFNELTPISKLSNNILKAIKENPKKTTPFLLSKSWNLINNVNYDIETGKGDIIANISKINKVDVDDAIDIMEKTYKKFPEHISPHYKLIENDNNKIDIATVCSLSIDGILLKNGIMSTPKYGGLLELSESPMFLELISYNGSSIDPHKIFIYKNLTSLTNKLTDFNRILASLKEVHYVAKEETKEIISKLKENDFSIYKISKPRELIYNAKIDNYNFGIVAGSGLNTIAAIKEKNIDIEVKAVEKIMPFESMEHL
ncbi:NrpR regulatory domain-containing protein [Methanobrevibacter sp. DSM 116169]|uniref:NrpR regulatory domain-containing protein n=1 Tax=Methanobrevibacter sp. DSM 116169 TaxID=3242727 RepID=UPI0038FBE6E5